MSDKGGRLAGFRRERLLVHALPILLFLVQRAGCAWAGIGMDVPWGYYQLIDRQELAAHPFWSLFFLHSQPPMLNALMAVILRWSAITGVTPEFWAAVVFAGLGAGIAWGVFQLTLSLTGRFGWAVLATALVLADPATHVFQHQYFYPLILQAAFVGLALCAVRCLNGAPGSAWYLLAAAGLAVLACNTSSLYHPLWVVGAAGLLVWFRQDDRGCRRMLPLVLLVVVAGVALWPLKNLAVFGQFTFSTWEGMNLARGAEGIPAEVARPEWRQETNTGLEVLRRRYPGAPLRVLEAETKGDGSVNMNHYRWVALNPRLKALAVRWRARHIGAWCRMAVAQYWMWTRAAYADCYLRGVDVPGDSVYRHYALLHQALAYPDLRPLLGEIGPGVANAVRSHVTRLPVAITLFGALWFPLILVGTLVLNRPGTIRGREATGRACLLMAYCVVWVLVVPCLTDGHEGNRMRFAVDPFITVLALKLIQDLQTLRAVRTTAPPACAAS